MYLKTRKWVWGVIIAAVLGSYCYYMVTLHQKALAMEKQKREQKQIAVRSSAPSINETDTLLEQVRSDPETLLPQGTPKGAAETTATATPTNTNAKSDEIVLSLDRPPEGQSTELNVEALQETQRVVDGFASLRNPELVNTESEHYKKMHNAMSELLVRQMQTPPSPKQQTPLKSK